MNGRRNGWLGGWGLMVLGVSLMIDAGLVRAETPAQGEYALALHGGAGGNPQGWTEGYRQLRLAALTELLDRGQAMLASGATALDVVESIVRELEDNEHFNAGRGCVLNELGQYELDASIMDGQSLACGAVASVTSTRYPISLARQVMLQTRHILLSGTGADEFGRRLGLPQATAEHFITPRQQQRWQRWKDAQTADHALSNRMPDSQSVRSEPGEEYFGTVGCVALDRHGNLAAATSTGGLVGKRWGRIGDSPIIGAGNYADNATCAVSGTGIGEEFIRHGMASDVAARMRYGGADLASAAAASMALLPEECGGIIAVDAAANVLALHNTQAMAFALANSKGQRQIQLMVDAKQP